MSSQLVVAEKTPRGDPDPPAAQAAPVHSVVMFHQFAPLEVEECADGTGPSWVLHHLSLLSRVMEAMKNRPEEPTHPGAQATPSAEEVAEGEEELEGSGTRPCAMSVLSCL